MSKSKEPETLDVINTFGELKAWALEQVTDKTGKGLAPKANLIEQVRFYTVEPFRLAVGIIEQIINFACLQKYKLSKDYKPNGYLFRPAIYYAQRLFLYHYGLNWYRDKLHSLLSLQESATFGDNPLDIWPKRKYEFSNLCPVGIFRDNYTSALSVARDYIDYVHELTHYQPAYIPTMPTALDDDILKERQITDSLNDINLECYSIVDFSFACILINDKRYIDNYDLLERKRTETILQLIKFRNEILFEIDIEHAQAQEKLLARQPAAPGEAQGEREAKGTGEQWADMPEGLKQLDRYVFKVIRPIKKDRPLMLEDMPDRIRDMSREEEGDTRQFRPDKSAISKAINRLRDKYHCPIRGGKDKKSGIVEKRGFYWSKDSGNSRTT